MSVDEPVDIGGIELGPGVTVSAAGLRVQFSRSSGPGGQNVNKLNTKAELWVSLSELRGLDPPATERLRRLAGSKLTANDEVHITDESTRSQEANRQNAMQRLRELIIHAKKRPKVRRPTRPTKASRKRRLDSKRKRGQTKASRGRPADENL